MRVLSVWSSARHASDWPSTARSDEIERVATIGISRDWRVSANIFSSPAGSSSPTVANVWYSSQRNMAGRKTRSDRRCMSATRSTFSKRLANAWSGCCTRPGNSPHSAPYRLRAGQQMALGDDQLLLLGVARHLDHGELLAHRLGIDPGSVAVTIHNTADKSKATST